MWTPARFPETGQSRSRYSNIAVTPIELSLYYNNQACIKIDNISLTAKSTKNAPKFNLLILNFHNFPGGHAPRPPRNSMLCMLGVLHILTTTNIKFGHPQNLAPFRLLCYVRKSLHWYWTDGGKDFPTNLCCNSYHHYCLVSLLCIIETLLHF